MALRHRRGREAPVHAPARVAADLLGRQVTADDLFALHRSVQAERVADIYKPLGSWKVEPNGTYAVDDSGAQVFVEYAAPEDVPALMAEVIDCVNTTRLRPDDAGEAAPAYARIHAGFVSIHPFRDGNGRLARLIANVPLLNAGLPPLVIPKEGERRVYNDTLARYQRRIGRITPETGVWPDPSELAPFTDFCQRCYTTTRRLVDRAFQQDHATPPQASG